MSHPSINRLPKYKELRETLRSAIVAGTFAPGDRLPSEHELAAKYNVSRPTVREAIRSLVQDGILECFQGKGTFVGKSRGAIKDIAFILCGRDHTDPLFSLILQGAEARCLQRGFRLVYSHCEKVENLSLIQSRLLDHQPVKGLVVTGILDLKWLMRLMDLHGNIVLVGDLLGPNRTPDVVLRIINERSSPFRRCLDYLVSLGHRRIAHITGSLNRVWFREPYEAYIQYLKDLGIPLDENLVIECADEGLDYGHCAMQRLLQLPNRPTAIFAANDRFAWGAIRAIREAQLRVPEDISVMGMGDLPLGDRRDFLTTMAFNNIEMGGIAVDHVIAGAEGLCTEIALTPKLIVRQSCAPWTPPRKPT